MRRRIEAVFSEAIVRGFRENDENGKTIGQRNPASWKHNLDRTSLKRRKVEVSHHAALPYADVPAFVADIRGRESLAARALEFCILTATRTGETIAAHTHAAEYQISPSKILEQSNEQRMDAGTPQTSVEGDSQLAAMAEVHRSQNT